MKCMRHFFSALILVFSVFPGGTSLIQTEKALGQTKGIPGGSYGRDPFFFPSGVRAPAKETPAPVKAEKEVKPDLKPVEAPPPFLSLRAILIGDRVRLASIDRQILTVGDMIHEERVLEIRSDRVILGKGNQKRSLFLSQSPIRLNVEEK
jgi:hypothetical protein